MKISFGPDSNIIQDSRQRTINLSDAEMAELHHATADPGAMAKAMQVEVRTRPDLWERVYAIRQNSDGTFWVRTHNYTYRSVTLADLRPNETDPSAAVES